MMNPEDLINPELFDIVNELEDDVRTCEEHPVQLSLYAGLFRSWIDDIKNCDVDLDGARRMAKRAHRTIIDYFNGRL